ncbi:MAG: GNAT family N-acetyltransferase [Fimbriimonadaceae bacterium]|nr:GNAT family N-acetyltransferase [Fimbriimonadaceae bacterium]
MLEIKRFEPSPEAYEASVPVYNDVHLIWPLTAAELERWDGYRDPRFVLEKWVGYMDGKVSFIGEVGHSETIHRRGRRYFYPNGLKETHDTPAEREFFDWLYKRVLEWDPYEVVTLVQSNQTSLLKLFEEWGFEHRQRERVSLLKLDSFHPEKWQGIFPKVAEQEIELVPFTTMDTGDESILRDLYDLAEALFHDVPQPDAHSMDSFETFKRRIETMPYNRRLRWYAKKDGKMIGQTAVIDNQADPTIGYTGLTGVRREFRRSGVATALKVNSLIAAKELGMKIIQTENEENNPMFNLNERLGFEECMSWFQLVKRLREPTEEDLRQD